ncbi:hypothetical protein HYG81_22195 (plasmid) [Natrinema zhouii]|nr:hypothetical protein [Natrinema zhouii]UHQ98683.1 hypothetical protein HYG81_22195 [Natrinema zhouii]
MSIRYDDLGRLRQDSAERLDVAATLGEHRHRVVVEEFHAVDGPVYEAELVDSSVEPVDSFLVRVGHDGDVTHALTMARHRKSR